jgi:hypothetical protein
MPRIRSLEARDENDLPVGFVTVPRHDAQLINETITWTCGLTDCTATGDHQSSAANAVAALEDHLSLKHGV